MAAKSHAHDPLMHYLGTQCIQFGLIHTELINLTKNSTFGPYNITRILGSFTLIPNNSHEKSYIYIGHETDGAMERRLEGGGLRRLSNSMLRKQLRIKRN